MNSKNLYRFRWTGFKLMISLPGPLFSAIKNFLYVSGYMDGLLQHANIYQATGEVLIPGVPHFVFAIHYRLRCLPK